MNAAAQQIPSTAALPRVLLVDDEPNVLASLSMNLKRRYQVVTADSGAKGLEQLAQGSFAVIVSDMRMPNMDGAAFLAQARKAAPDVVRMLLTGQSDINSAISAVNDGQIFRFLTKPTPPEVLLGALESAMAQHRLITAEKVLLEQTLRGSLRTMTEILALANPVLFGRSTRIKRLVVDLAQKLQMGDAWHIEVAALLSPLAQVSLPSDTADKLGRGAELSGEERAMVDRLPELTDQLLAHIPRLETVRVMLAHAQEPYHQANCIQPASDAQLVARGAKIIKTAIAFDALTQGGLSPSDAVGALRTQPERHDEAIVKALGDLHASSGGQRSIIDMPVAGLLPGMILAEDLVSRTGLLLVTRGFEVTTAFMERVRNYKTGTLKDTVRIIRGHS